MNLIDTHNPDIIFGTESWLNSDILSSEIFPDGYSVYRQDQLQGDGFGIVFHRLLRITSCIVDIANN